MIRRLEASVKQFLARVALLSVELVIVTIAFFTALTAFIYIARMVFFKKYENFDNAVFSFFSNHINNINTEIMQVFSFLGSHYFLIPANLILAAVFLTSKKFKWFSVKIPVISLSSLLLMQVLKTFFHRNRPLTPLLQQAKGLSFPSGHALMSFTFYGLIIYLVWQGLQNKIMKIMVMVFLMLLIIFIGLSRIYLRVHYASDVIAGFSLGLIWLVLSLIILGKMEQISRKEIDPSLQK